jgi:hypothetical protein
MTKQDQKIIIKKLKDIINLTKAIESTDDDQVVEMLTNYLNQDKSDFIDQLYQL